MMNEHIVHMELAGELVELHVYRSLYWKRHAVLLISDLHLGKVNHFRKFGVAVPPAVSRRNYARLFRLLQQYRPERVLMLGDLFHSDMNAEWEQLKQLTTRFAHITFQLVPGNHDIVAPGHYADAGIELLDENYEEGPFLFSHKPLEDHDHAKYNLAGHLHPGVRLRGKGGQSTRLSCFYFSSNQGIMPAFGNFTGNALVTPRKKDRLFLLTERRIIPWQFSPAGPTKAE